MHRAKFLYHEALTQNCSHPYGANSRMHGYWAPSPDVKASDLLALVERAETQPDTHVIKHNVRTQVIQARIHECDVLIKRYDLPHIGLRLKYAARPSRARRAWAAAVTMRRLDIPTPQPLGFLEIAKHGLPSRSYFFSEFLPHARAAHKWIKPFFHQQSAGLRKKIRQDILHMLLNLYRHGVYHGDAKISNMLLREPEHDQHRTFFWIDLECVRFGVRPTKREIIRNLVQLNGSLGSKVPEEDRYAFLQDMAQVYPWLLRAKIEQKIRRWTLNRLNKELRRAAGP